MMTDELKAEEALFPGALFLSQQGAWLLLNLFLVHLLHFPVWFLTLDVLLYMAVVRQVGR